MKTIIELLGVIAWPATVIIAIILLKKEIHALLARLTKVKKYVAFCLDLAARITAADTILKGKSQQGGGGHSSPAAGSPSPDR
jgi:hypothetical protein